MDRTYFKVDYSHIIVATVLAENWWQKTLLTLLLFHAKINVVTKVGRLKAHWLLHRATQPYSSENQLCCVVAQIIPVLEARLLRGIAKLMV